LVARRTLRCVARDAIDSHFHFRALNLALLIRSRPNSSLLKSALHTIEGNTLGHMQLRVCRECVTRLPACCMALSPATRVGASGTWWHVSERVYVRRHYNGKPSIGRQSTDSVGLMPPNDQVLAANDGSAPSGHNDRLTEIASLDHLLRARSVC